MWRAPAADETRDRLLRAALPHVPFDGWSDAALLTAAAEIGLEPEEARQAFPGGPVALVAYHAAYADRRLEEALKEVELGEMRLRERIAHAVRLRLEQNAAHREAIRAALPILAQPTNGPHALASLYRTVDTIWFAVGDRSTDFGFYTKRALLAGVYLSTLLYWLNDGSEGAAATWGLPRPPHRRRDAHPDHARALRPLPPARIRAAAAPARGRPRRLGPDAGARAAEPTLSHTHRSGEQFRQQAVEEGPAGGGGLEPPAAAL